MKVFCHASNTPCLCYLKKHHNQFRENMYTWANSTFQWDWEHFGFFPPTPPPSHVWRLGFDSPPTGYFFSMFLPLGLRSSRTLFLKFGYGLRHTMVLCYIAPIPFRTTLIILDLWPSLSKYWSHFVAALTSKLLKIWQERFLLQRI